LSVQSLRIRYAEDLPEVLHGVSFDLGARERLGIVGRSGSGKSTLTKAILRFCEPSAGRIIIGGIDITSIGVNDLRSRLVSPPIARHVMQPAQPHTPQTYIPQEAALFNGTIRNNLDPQGEHDDVVLQAALNSSFLNASAPESPPMTPGPSIPMGISRIPSEVGFTRPPSPLLHSVTVQWDEGPSTSHQPTKFTLDTLVAPYGSNFSQGQRQLISLARAMVRQSAIVLSDEATSSVDYRTDSLIQKSMTGNFRDSALIVVAHRLSTVMNFDRIIVMEAGCVIEW
jgi:ABC-type multidrug transport system fused ATPase/permease subunit